MADRAESRFGAEDSRRLAALLRSLGATDDEVGRALADATASDLALDLTLRNGRPPLSVQEAAAKANGDLDQFAAFWRALGFSDPTADEDVTVPAALADALPIVSQAVTEFLGEETAMGIARVIGSAGARLAETLVDAFRVDYEVPQLAAGTSYAEIVERYTQITKESLPALEAVLCAVLRAHLVRVAAGAWSPDEERTAATRDLFVGFADLVGYTALSRTLSPGELATLLGRFEATVTDVVSASGGRLVKLIGDGAMFAADTAASGCELALTLVARVGDVAGLPPIRVGAACGDVMSRYGDYYGDVVNLAARLVALANPSTVVVSAAVAAACERSFGFERLPLQALKGFHAPPVTYRLTGRSTGR